MLAIPPARDVYQSVLDRLATAVAGGDLAGISDLVWLPFKLRTPGGVMEYHTEDARDAAVALLADMFSNYGATTIERVCRVARYRRQDEIIGHHTTLRCYPEGKPPELYDCQMHLYWRDDGGWAFGAHEVSVLPWAWDEFVKAGQLPSSKFDVTQADRIPDDELAILQAVLDWVCTALLANDPQSWADIVDLPLTLMRGGRIEVFETEDELRNDYALFHASFTRRGITDIVHVARNARWIDENTIEGQCLNYYLNHGTPVIDPWHTTVTIKRKHNGYWRVSNVRNAMTSPAMVDTLQGELIPKPTSAKSIAENLLNITGKAFRTQNFELFRTAFRLPLTLETTLGETILATEADMRAKFVATCEHDRKTGVTEMTRTVEAAEFSSPTTVMSTHVTRLKAGNRLIEEPFPVLNRIEKTDGDWKVTRCELGFQKGRAYALEAGEPPKTG